MKEHPVEMIQVKVVKKSRSTPLPEYQTPGSSGMDVCADLEIPIVLQNGVTSVIPTGLFLEIPRGYECQIRSRSGLAAKSDIMVLNSPGTIDSDYRGELKVILHNAGTRPFTIENGMRIAQLVFAPVVRADLIKVESLGESQRGEGGFGSTGVKA